MAHLSKKKLKAELDKTAVGDAGYKRQIKSAYTDLVDTAVTHNPPEPDVTFSTTSGSGVVNVEMLQPANTVLTDLVVLCTSEATLASANLIGVRAGTTEGGVDIVPAVNNALNKDGATLTTIAVGKGTSIHAKLAASFSGSALTFAAYPAVVNSTSTDRTIYVQISGSTGDTDTFSTNTGAFKPILHYERL